MIAVSSSGKSFRALAAYLAAGRTGEERDRVAWSVARNLPTDQPELAATFMRATAAQSTKVEKPVYHLVLSFDPADMPDRAAMERVADKVLNRLGLAEHQAVIVAHHDRSHAHVHLLVNRVHPELGRAWERWKDQPLIQQVLREEEQALGLRAVDSSLTRSVTIEGPHAERVGGHNLRPNGDQPHPSQHRERAPNQPLDAIVEALERHERLSTLKHEIQVTRSEIDATQARLTQLQLAHARAQSTDEAFRRLLTGVYRDAETARCSFTHLASERGSAHAVEMMAEHPEQFGALLTSERRLLGLRTATSDHEARQHAGLAARAGEQAITAEAQMWIVAAEARVRRLEETFESQLREVFVDAHAARTAFATINARDGIEVAIGTLRTAPERLAALRSTELVEPNVRQSVLDRTAVAAGEATRARSELENLRTTGLPQTELAARPQVVTAELQASREHATTLTNRERSARIVLGGLPRRAELEHQIRQIADRLLPHEIRKLKTVITAPRLALLAKIRSTVRDALLARDERSA